MCFRKVLALSHLNLPWFEYLPGHVRILPMICGEMVVSPGTLVSSTTGQSLGATGMNRLELAKSLQSKLSIEKGLSKSGGVVIDVCILKEDNVHVAVVRYAVIW